MSRESIVIDNLDVARESILNIINPHSRIDIQRNNERSWRWSFIKDQFDGLALEELFLAYENKIKQSYFAIFLILEFFISTTQFTIVLATNAIEDTLDVVILDLILYGFLAFLPIVGLFISECYKKTSFGTLRIMAGVAFLLLYVTDISLPIVHSNIENFRPAYTTHLIIACYLFLNMSKLFISCIMGAVVTISHILLLIFITYEDSDILGRRLSADIAYLVCVNGIGLYFRLMNEIVIRKSFLDRRACVESTLRLKWEKDQEETLLLTIIPKYILKKVSDSMTERVNALISSTAMPKEVLFLETHKDVTILYADIVNYTVMTSKLRPVTKLVEVLNDLFVSFDSASEELNVLRIKFLGDCYYCVSGLPERNERHAEACVDLGLRMISIIRRVRQNRELDVDMRIGVHTGNIMGGIIGTRKLHFDVWSKDVTIANRMESTGQPGKVHITRQTKDILPPEKYIITSSSAGDTDAYLNECKISTFLVTPKESEKRRTTMIKFEGIPEETDFTPEKNGSLSKHLHEADLKNTKRKSKIYVRRETKSKIDTTATRRLSKNPGRPSNTDMKRRTAFMDSNIKNYHERLKNVDSAIQEAIDTLPLSKYHQWFNSPDIQPFLLLFRKLTKEIKYFKQPDPLFKFYVTVQIGIFIAVIVIQNLTMIDWDWTSTLIYIALGFIIILIPFTWAQYWWMTSNKNNFVEEKNLPFYYKISQFITDSYMLRTTIYILICTFYLIYLVVELTKCNSFKDEIHNDEDRTYAKFFGNNFNHGKNSAPELECIIPWHMTQIAALALMMSFLFLKIHLWIKTIFAFVVAAFYIFCIFYRSGDYFEDSETYNHMMSPTIAHTIGFLYLGFTLHLIERQNDYMNRLDFQWNEKLMIEENDANIKNTVNKSLLYNILPVHVAEIYLDTNRKYDPSIPYAQSYDNIAVMFASIVGYDLTVFEDEHQFLQIMNDVIKSFDMILEKFTRIEKIKLANWTYMAACGLDTAGTNVKLPHDDDDVIHLLKFAVEITNALATVNSHWQQELKLRIGICHGAVTAGVVGSRKPLYDIWGDTVNMASRMDSTGSPDRIQIMEKTAKIIMDQGYKCDYRGLIYVKGKSAVPNVPDIPTYFVTTTTLSRKEIRLVRIDSITEE